MTLESKEHLKNKVHSRLVRERKSAKEIQEVLDSLKARPLEYSEYKAMPQDIASWHEFANSANVDKALQAHQVEQKSAAQKKDSDISRMWTGQTTEEETAVCKATAEEFLSKYQHFTRIPENSAAIADRMRTKNLSPHQLSSFVKAFEELAVEGRLILNGKIAGICEDEMVGGHELRTHKELYRFLRPTSTAEQLEQMKAKKMSADEWKRSRPELQDGVPFVVQQQFFKAAKSLAYFEPEYIFNDGNNEKILAELKRSHGQFNLSGLRAAFSELKKRGELELASVSVSGQIITHTEYEPRETGQPEAPGKLRAKVARMSSTEMATFLRENPSARKAIDSV